MSGEIPVHHCTNEQRIAKVEVRLDAHDTTLTDGKIEFASIKKDLAQIMVTQAEIKLALSNRTSDIWDKVLGAVVFWGVPAICGGLLWAVVKSGAAGIK